jgi:hypothetical protein
LQALPRLKGCCDGFSTRISQLNASVLRPKQHKCKASGMSQISDTSVCSRKT